MATAEGGLRAGELAGKRPSLLEWLGVGLNRVPLLLLCRASQFVIDAFLSAIALYLAYQLRFDGNVPPVQRPVLWSLMLLVPVLRPLSIWAFGGYEAIWRYFNLRDALVLMLSSLPPTAVLLIMRFGVGTRLLLGGGFPATVIVIEYGSYLLLSTSIRGFRRLTFEASLRAGATRRRAMLVGTDHSLATALRQVSIYPDVEVVGLLAPGSRLQGLRIGGFTVMDEPSALPSLLASKSVELVLIADASLDCIGATVEVATDFGAEVRLLPSAANVLRGDVRISALAKPELALPERAGMAAGTHPAVVEAFRGRVVLITGAGGSIGSEMSRQIAALPVRTLVLLDHDENSIFEIHRELADSGTPVRIVPVVGNIRDHVPLRGIFAKCRPDVVLHAAAYKHVPVMEQNCCEAVLNNVLGTRELLEAALEFEAERFVMISTDKAVHPTSIMGATKRVAELLVQAETSGNGHRRTRCACVRFGNVMGSRGSVVPIFMKQIAEGGPITITHEEMTRYFMTIPEAVQLVLEAATLGANGDIYMLDMGDPVKIMSLARKLVQMSGLTLGKDIEIRVVGTRPGEKLHEQLWTEGAKVSATMFPYVFAVHADPATREFEAQLQRLEEAAFSRDDELVLERLEAIPIGFKRQRCAAAAAGD
jgi:FlaA1/EpsC-like NDP-sugar epimerase